MLPELNIAKTHRENKVFLQQLQKQTMFSTKQLDDYLMGNSTPELAQQIESDPDCLEWLNDSTSSH